MLSALRRSVNENKQACFFIIAVQTPGSGISILLAVGTPSTGSGNSLLAVGMPCAFYTSRETRVRRKDTSDENPIRTLGDYSKPSHEVYRNTIELLEGNNVVPLRFDTIRTDSFQRLTPKAPHHGIDLWLQVQIFYDHVNHVTRQTIDQSAGGKLRNRNAKEPWALLEDLALYDNESWNDPRDFAKPVKAIPLP
uniref:MAK10-like protein n=1 Tax=Tanacetum cinerariifolium TaxID=118510 RepID=A0A6L2P7F2_TANCI|nr:MAK10-like protein [Tanacetum cinerariifolium]